MKTIILFVLLINVVLTPSTGWSQPTIPPVNKAKLPVSKAVSTPRDIMLTLIDPSVTAITFTPVKLTAGDKLKITGTVKNIGGKAFESGSNQQVVQLFEIRTPTNRVMLKQIPFSRLNPGEELKIEYSIPALKPADEFPPDYQVLIVYDPDIMADGNKNNDDARYDNNTFTKNPRN